jgi:dTDP-glucose 4,6-dehydratase
MKGTNGEARTSHRVRKIDIAPYWNGRKVVVTGAGGFIGSHLVSLLLEEGADVTALVRYNSRGEQGLLRYATGDGPGRLSVVAGDIRDARAVRELVRGHETVFHLAALIGIPYSYSNPTDVVHTNVLGTLNVLNAALDEGHPRVVHTSTSEAYGTAQYVPIDELHPLQGQSPYAASKIGADKLAESYYRSFGLQVTTVRPFNSYGPRQSARAVIPTIISQALSGESIRLGSTDTRRDFTFVEDTARGFLLAGQSEAAIGDVINVGSGSEITVSAVVEEVCRIVGREVVVELDEQRLRPDRSEVQRLLCDRRKANGLLGWAPTISFSEGLRRTIDWVASYPEMYPTHAYAV